MKFTKMSLVAALLIGSSAFAIENTKVSGDAKLFYNTDDQGTVDLFNKDQASGQAAISLGLTTDLTKNVSAGTKVTALSTLGLQGQLVNNVWEGTNGVSDSWMVNELWLAGTVGNTTGKIGRMELDTPLVFSEQWSIVANTFEAAVVINEDIPDTTLIGAYVGGGNGSQENGGTGSGYVGLIAAKGGTNDTTFGQFYNGAYAAGVINNSFKPLTAQAWYYDATHILSAYWLQADLDATDLGVKGLTAGVQYSAVNPNAAGAKSGDIYAVKLGYEMADMFAASVAYSSTNKDAGAGGNLAAYGQSKIYTEAWWDYGYITRADTTAYNVTVTSPVQGMFDLGVFYTSSKTKQAAPSADIKMTDLTITAGKDFGPLNTTLVYDNTNADDLNNGKSFNSIQVYLTYNF